MLRNEDFIELGFKPIPTFNIGNGLTFELGRNRCLSASSVGTPNEMIFIYEHSETDFRHITDIITLHNYDYDGYITVDKLKMLINDIECSYYWQCPFNFFQSDMNSNLVLYNALTIENIDKNYVFERLMSAKEHIMVYDSKIKNEDDTFKTTEFRTVYRTPLPGYDVVPEVMFYKKKNVVESGLKWIEEAELCLMAI